MLTVGSAYYSHFSYIHIRFRQALFPPFFIMTLGSAGLFFPPLCNAHIWKSVPCFITTHVMPRIHSHLFMLTLWCGDGWLRFGSAPACCNSSLNPGISQKYKIRRHKQRSGQQSTHSSPPKNNCKCSHCDQLSFNTTFCFMPTVWQFGFTVNWFHCYALWAVLNAFFKALMPILESTASVLLRYIFLIYTVIRFVWVSATFGTWTVVSVNGTLVEEKIRRFKGECAHFCVKNCFIYTHDGANVKFSTNSPETDNSVTHQLCA